MMNIKKFNEKYQSKGGFAKLTELKQNLATLENIGKHFELSKERIKQLMIVFFGEAYDPRKDRRNNLIKAMLKFAETHTEKEFMDAFVNENGEYLKEALHIARITNLFKKDV